MVVGAYWDIRERRVGLGGRGEVYINGVVRSDVLEGVGIALADINAVYHDLFNLRHGIRGEAQHKRTILLYGCYADGRNRTAVAQCPCCNGIGGFGILCIHGSDGHCLHYMVEPCVIPSDEGIAFLGGDEGCGCGFTVLYGLGAENAVIGIHKGDGVNLLCVNGCHRKVIADVCEIGTPMAEIIALSRRRFRGGGILRVGYGFGLQNRPIPTQEFYGVFCGLIGCANGHGCCDTAEVSIPACEYIVFSDGVCRCRCLTAVGYGFGFQNCAVVINEGHAVIFDLEENLNGSIGVYRRNGIATFRCYGCVIYQYLFHFVACEGSKADTEAVTFPYGGHALGADGMGICVVSANQNGYVILHSGFLEGYINGVCFGDVGNVVILGACQIGDFFAVHIDLVYLIALVREELEPSRIAFSYMDHTLGGNAPVLTACGGYLVCYNGIAAEAHIDAVACLHIFKGIALCVLGGIVYHIVNVNIGDFVVIAVFVGIRCKGEGNIITDFYIPVLLIPPLVIGGDGSVVSCRIGDEVCFALEACFNAVGIVCDFREFVITVYLGFLVFFAVNQNGVDDKAVVRLDVDFNT